MSELTDQQRSERDAYRRRMLDMGVVAWTESAAWPDVTPMLVRVVDGRLIEEPLGVGGAQP